MHSNYQNSARGRMLVIRHVHVDADLGRLRKRRDMILDVD